MITERLAKHLSLLSFEESIDIKFKIKSLKDQYENMLRRNISPAKRAKYFNTLIDNSLNDFLDKRPGISERITCKPGCSICCSTLVNISRDESELLYEYAAQNNLEIDFEKLKRQARVKTLNGWKRLKEEDRACVFLGENGLCSAYEARPSICRKWLTVSGKNKCKEILKGKLAKKSKIVFVTNCEIIDSAVYNVTKSDTLARALLRVHTRNNSSEINSDRDSRIYT